MWTNVTSSSKSFKSFPLNSLIEALQSLMQNPSGKNINTGYRSAPIKAISGLRFLSKTCNKETIKVKIAKVT